MSGQGGNKIVGTPTNVTSANKNKLKQHLFIKKKKNNSLIQRPLTLMYRNVSN